jgi:hypothetical protein
MLINDFLTSSEHWFKKIVALKRLIRKILNTEAAHI